MMDGSLSALFIDTNLQSLPFSWNQVGESTEELSHMLVCASMELESARAAAKAHRKLHDARVRHLEELLKTTRRERDEAREQCLKLQERLENSAVLASALPDIVDLPDIDIVDENPTGIPAEPDSRLTERESVSCSYMISSTASSSSEQQPHLDSLSTMHDGSQ
eukprot:c34261_g1_i1 orf=150-641(+)